MKIRTYGLWSEPDSEFVIFVMAKNKKHALKMINDTGGYQDEPLEENCDYYIKRTPLDVGPMDDLINSKGERCCVGDVVERSIEIFMGEQNEN